MTGRSSLVVPLAGLASVVPPLGRGSDAPHITLVDPFADPAAVDDGVVAELTSYFADALPFRVGFTGISQFPGGPAYLTPDPSAPFRHLAQGVLRLFPELPRRHRTLDMAPQLVVDLGPQGSFEQLQRDLGPWLPVETLAREAALWTREDDGVRVLATFPFGTSAA